MKEIIFSSGIAESKQLSRLCREGRLRRVYRGIYTNNLTDSLEEIVLRHWMHIVAHIVSAGILSFRTAMDLKTIPYKKGQAIVFVTSSYSKTITLPGLVIKVLQGNNRDYIEPVLPSLSKSNEARLLLENLSSVRGAHFKGIKTVSEEDIETYLAKIMRSRKEGALNTLRDEAKIVSEKLGYASEYQKLTAMISALLSTHKDKKLLKTSFAKAIVKKEPYDTHRLQLFESLSLYLRKCHFQARPYKYSKNSFRNLSFFESYFSNFIEGTEFIIDEAEDIVFSRRQINHRHADSHDVLALYQLTNDLFEMEKVPKNKDEFLKLLQERHAFLMEERRDKRPGQFKKEPNKSGNTYFVMPDEVVGTLYQGFEIYDLLSEGLPKALFMHFLVSEVHPFDDGNGRLSRLMMNAELVRSGFFKMIIPTVHRDNYLNGLRIATRDQEFRSYCKVMDQAHAYTSSINWSDYEEARVKIEKDQADKTPDEGLPIFNRALRELDLSELG